MLIRKEARLTPVVSTGPLLRNTEIKVRIFLSCDTFRIRGSGRFPKRNSVAPDSTPQQQKQPKEQKPATRKAEEEDFFTQLTKMQGDRIDDQRVSAPVRMLAFVRACVRACVHVRVCVCVSDSYLQTQSSISNAM